MELTLKQIKEQAKIVLSTGKEAGSFIQALANMTVDYNGWTNRSTWAYALWLSNTQEMQEVWTTQTGLCVRKENPLRELSQRLQAYLEKTFDDCLNGNGTEDDANMIRDVGNGYDINYREIAESLLKEHELNEAYKPQKP